MEFVLFEDVNGQEVFVNPKRVVWVREYGDKNTVISCGTEDKFTVRLSLWVFQSAEFTPRQPHNDSFGNGGTRGVCWK